MVRGIALYVFSCLVVLLVALLVYCGSSIVILEKSEHKDLHYTGKCVSSVYPDHYLTDLNDTTLFRLLAEKMMLSNKETAPLDINQPTKAWMNSTESSRSLLSTNRSQSNNTQSTAGKWCFSIQSMSTVQSLPNCEALPFEVKIL